MKLEEASRYGMKISDVGNFIIEKFTVGSSKG